MPRFVTTNGCGWVLIFLLAALLALPTLVHAQTYETMQMIRPIATGSAGTGLHANNRVYRAYTGITYEIHADAVGGKWPYTYSLSNAPAGMTIEAGPCVDIGPTGCTAGTITWVNPTSTASNITVTITDSLGTQVSGTWTVTVGTSGFCFVDSVSGSDSNSGTLASPWQTLAKALNTSTGCGANSILYFRAGSYNFASLSPACTTEAYGCAFQINETSRPVIWIGYPGETATIDFQGNGGGDDYYFNTDTNNTFWLDSLTFDNVGCNAFRISRLSGRFGVVVRKTTWLELVDAQGEGNCAYVMLKNQYNYDVGPSYFDTIQNNTFGYAHGDGIGTDNGSQFKSYSTLYMLIENNRFENNAMDEAALAPKTENQGFTIRGNVFAADVATPFGGNLHSTAWTDAAGTNCSLDHTTDTINHTTHGYSNGNIIIFHFSNPVPTGNLTKELAYYVINQTTNAYQVSTTEGGAAVTFDSNGVDCDSILRSRVVYTGGELYHNLFLGSGTTGNQGNITIGIARTAEIGPIAIYRNTLIGGRTVMELLAAHDGPFNFYSNVIVNAGGSGGSCPARLTCVSVVDYSVINVDANNLQGANDGTIANATTGALINRANVGTYGHELSNAVRRFAPLLNLRR